MYSLDSVKNSTYSQTSNRVYAANKPVIPPVTTSPMQNSVISFSSSNAVALQSNLNVRTTLTTNEEKEKYAQLTANLDKKDRKNLEILLKTGILLNTNSNDKSSTMDNLYKMLTEPRAVGITPQVALKETIDALARPEAICQTFGDIPEQYVKPILKVAQKNPKMANDEINEKTINVGHSATCVATSIEFKLAKQTPAEYARFAQELTSPKLSVDKTIHLNNLADNTLDAVWLLNAFEVPYEMKNFNTAKLTLSPDKNAIIRAQVQNSNRDPGERSLIDALMQSTFMNVGSQQAYDSLTDVRGGKFSQNDRGLIEFEKTFTESVVEDKNEISVTYQNIDQDGKLAGYETDFNTIKRQLLDSIASGESVVIGYTLVDKDKTVINSHEITIVGAKQNKNGKLTFICYDSDDNNPNLIEYPEDYIIPKIHHAGLPKEVAEKDVKYVDTWVEGLQAYKENKNKSQSQNFNKIA